MEYRGFFMTGFAFILGGILLYVVKMMMDHNKNLHRLKEVMNERRAREKAEALSRKETQNTCRTQKPPAVTSQDEKS